MNTDNPVAPVPSDDELIAVYNAAADHANELRDEALHAVNARQRDQMVEKNKRHVALIVRIHDEYHEEQNAIRLEFYREESEVQDAHNRANATIPTITDKTNPIRRPLLDACEQKRDALKAGTAAEMNRLRESMDAKLIAATERRDRRISRADKSYKTSGEKILAAARASREEINQAWREARTKRLEIWNEYTRARNALHADRLRVFGSNKPDACITPALVEAYDQATRKAFAALTEMAKTG